MIDFAAALNLYDEAVGNGQPDELLRVGDQLAGLAQGDALTPTQSVNVTALALHLRTVATLSLPDDSAVENFLAEIRSLAATASNPIVQSVHAIITFCSFYPSQDPTRLAEALTLFSARERKSEIARLDTAFAINEIRTHSLALEQNVAGHSADRVEELAAALNSAPLAPRLQTILAPTLAAFYTKLASTYADPRFLRQGLSLLEPMARDVASPAAADAALGGVWQLIALGLEYDAGFPVPRDLIARAQSRVRAHRSARLPPDLSICEMAHGLGLRARFDWERSGKRSGILRALGYLRVAAQMRHLAGFFATTLRVAYEAGLGSHFLQESLRAFEAARAVPGVRPSPPDDANYASTLMLIGNAEGDPVRLAQAIDLYESAIGRQPASAVNVSRYINLASAARSYARLRGGLEPLADPETRQYLNRGLDAVIMVEVLDRAGSTHAGMHESIAAAYYALFRAQLGDAATDITLLKRTIALFDGKEARWPIGLTLFLGERLIAATQSGHIDCDLQLQSVNTLERAKLLLQVLDLCDGTGKLEREISTLFAASIEALRTFIGAGREAEGLIVVDRLTAGFVRQVAGAHPAIDERAALIARRAIAGAPLSDAEASLIRRSAIANQVETNLPVPPLTMTAHVQLDLLQADGRLLAIRRDSQGLVARLFAARTGPLTSGDAEFRAQLASFALESSGPLWLTFRNFPPELSHELFNALRDEVGTRDIDRLVLRHGASSFSEVASPLPWNASAGPPRFLIVHSPRNEAPSLNLGFQFVARVRARGAEVAELALEDCRRDSIKRLVSEADALIVISHGHRGDGAAPDRILLADAEYLDAAWLLELGPAAAGKTLFFVACNSGHFNARLTHDDIGFAPLALAMGARGVFSTLRSVDELTILIFLLEALDRWQQGDGLSEAFELARLALLGFDSEAWRKAHLALIGGGMAARAAYRAPLGGRNSPTGGYDRADVDIGWSFVFR